jgi:hypothetical protein
MNLKIEKFSGPLGHERLTIKNFKTSDAMGRFMTTGDNGLRWCTSSKNLKPGTYVMLGGEYRNIKSIAPMMLSHC